MKNSKISGNIKKSDKVFDSQTVGVSEMEMRNETNHTPQITSNQFKLQEESKEENIFGIDQTGRS